MGTTLTCPLAAWVDNVAASAAPYAASPRDPDALLNGVAFAFHACRAGVLVSIRDGGASVTLVPFANGEYRGPMAGVSGLQPAADTRWGTPLPQDRWWFNGAVVCDTLPHDVWGPYHLREVEAMLRAAAPLPNCDFILNKRDYPLLRADGLPAAADVFGPCAARAPPTTVAILSFYTGPEYADVPFPTTEDWKLACGRDKGGAAPPWGATATLAGFRGAPTGRGTSAATNVRLRLVEWAAHHGDLADCKLTSSASRRRVLLPEDDPGGRVRVGGLPPDVLPPPACFLPMADQAARWRYLVYADGHCASNRWGALLASGRVILRVAPTGTGAWTSWLLLGAVGARVADNGTATLPPGADHFLVDPDLSNARATIQYLRDHDDVAWKVAQTALQKAPTLVSVIAGVRLAVAAAARIQPRLRPGDHVPLVGGTRTYTERVPTPDGTRMKSVHG